MCADSLTFLGAARTVTGSRYLLDLDGRRLLVDAGMFQGEKQWRLRNWADFPVPPDTIGDIVLTHAHMDHCGYLPALVARGFSGAVWCTPGTRDLAAIVLRDAGFLAEREARDAAAGGWSKHTPPLPLYSGADVERTLPLLRPVEFDTDADLGDGVSVRFTRAGHILGSASVTVRTRHTSVLFSGDLGRHDHPVLRPRDTPPGAPFVVVESTYGDREHPEPRNLPHEALADAIRRTVQRGGSVLVPAFAIDRTEVVLRTLAELRAEGRIPSVPIYVNSPMATAALEVYRRASGELRPDIDIGEFTRMDNVHLVGSAEESMALTTGRHRGPSIVISSSGMVNGGRVLHHLRADAAGRAQLHRADRLSGSGDTRAGADGGGQATEDARCVSPGQGRDRRRPGVLGARGCLGPPRLGPGSDPAADDGVRHPRGGVVGGGAGRADR